MAPDAGKSPAKSKGADLTTALVKGLFLEQQRWAPRLPYLYDLYLTFSRHLVMLISLAPRR